MEVMHNNKILELNLPPISPTRTRLLSFPKKTKKTLDQQKQKGIANQKKERIPKINILDTAQIGQFMNCGGMKLHTRFTMTYQKKEVEYGKHAHYLSVVNEKSQKHYKKEQLATMPVGVSQERDKNNFSLHRASVGLSVLQSYSRARDLPVYRAGQYLVRKQSKKAKELVVFLLHNNTYSSLFRCEDEQAHIVVHPNILQPLGLIELEEGKTRYYATDNFEGFTLQNMLSEFGKLEEPLVKQLIRQLMLGVHFLHCHRLAHNRLNLQTLLYNEQGTLFINNFGHSKKPLNEADKLSNTYYYPPEMLLSKSNNDSEKNDIWAIGCITLQLFTKKAMRLNQLHPYNKNVSPNCDVLTESCSLIDNVQQMYIKRDESEVMENKCQLSASILDFITKCMSVQISKRPSIEQLMLHPFFKD